MSAYCEVNDLKIGDITMRPTEDMKNFVQWGGEEIDIALGTRYAVPINTAATGFPYHEKLILKHINVLISSGLFMLSAAAGVMEAHQYGQSLLEEGRNRLSLLVGGSVVITGADPATSPIETAPTIVNADDVSGVDMFYEVTMREDPWTWIASDLTLGPRWAPGKW